jgi:hypothetical protein
MTTPYTTSDAIAAYLGATFTTEQAATADAIAASATAYIDGATGRSWQEPSPIVAEWLPVIARRDDGAETTRPTIYLQRTPVVSIEAVSVRGGGANEPSTALAANEYELVDAANGVLRLAATALWTGYGSTYLYSFGAALVALVDYSFAAAPPPDIALAATMIGAAEMARVVASDERSALLEAHPELAGLKSVAVGQNDVNVALQDEPDAASATSGGSSWAAPGSAVAGILAHHRVIVVA